MRYRRRDPNRDHGPASYGFEGADFPAAMSNYAAGVRDLDPEDRPDFMLEEWVDEHGQPTVPGWVPEPASAPPAAADWGTLPGHRADHCMSMLPGCMGECGG